MAIAYGGRAGSNHGNTAGASETVTTTVSIPSGSLIVVSVSGSNVGDTSNLTSVTDSAGNTYQSAAFTCDPGQNTVTAVWYSVTGTALGSGGTVTVTFHSALLSSGESWEITVDWLAGAATASATDGSNGKNSQTGGTWNTNSITTTNANDLVWVAAGTNQGGTLTITNAGSTPTTGWTVLARVSGGAGNNNQLQSAYQVFAATGTYQGGGTAGAGNNGTSAVIVAFKAASGGGGTPQAIAGTGSAVAGGSVSLTDTKKPAGTGAASFGASLTLTDTKKPAGTGSAVFNGSGTLTDTKKPSGTGGAVFGGSLTLTDTKKPSGTGSPRFSASVDLTVVGPIDLSGTGSATAGGSVTLTDTKKLSGTAAVSVGATVSLTRTKGIAGTGGVAAGGSLSLTDAKKLSATSSVGFSASVSLTVTNPNYRTPTGTLAFIEPTGTLSFATSPTATLDWIEPEGTLEWLPL